MGDTKDRWIWGTMILIGVILIWAYFFASNL